MDAPIDNFVQFLDSFAPGIARQLVGAQAREIDDLEALVGAALPEVYRGYLLATGRSPSVLPLFEDADSRIERLLDHYRNVILTGEQPAPANAVLVAVSGRTFAEACLELGAADGRVLATLNSKVSGVYADSFTKLLFKTAFLRYRPNQLKKSAIYFGTTLTPALEKIRGMSQLFDFSQEWFSDSVNLCLDRKDAALVAQQFVGGYCWARVAADREQTIETIGAVLEQQCQMQFNQWFSPRL